MSETTVRMKLLVFERSRVRERVIDAKRRVYGNCGVWYSRDRDLHRFFIATARAIVNDYSGLDGTVFDPCVWSVGSLPKRSRVREGVRKYAMLFGPRSLPSGRCGFLPVAVQKQKPRASLFSIEDNEATRFQNPRSRSRMIVRSNHLGSRTSYQVGEHQPTDC